MKSPAEEIRRIAQWLHLEITTPDEKDTTAEQRCPALHEIYWELRKLADRLDGNTGEGGSSGA
jgi:hypothetical protein